MMPLSSCNTIKYDMIMIISFPCPLTKHLGGLNPENGIKKTHVGGYPRCGITARVQTQRFPIGPWTSAELHIVDVLNLAHLFALGPTRRAGSAALPQFDAAERRYA